MGGVTVDVTDDNVLRSSIPREAFVSIQNKEEVFEGLAYFTLINERNNPTNANEKELYSTCMVEEIPLDTYRLQDRPVEEEAEAKEEIIKGLVSTLFLVSRGLVYDVLLNPLNFVYNTKKRKVKAFIRKDKPLAEITDEWLYEVKKLVAFYLVHDSGLRVEEFENYTLHDMETHMTGDTLKGFERLKSANSVGEMAEVLLSEQELRPLVTYPPIVTPHVVPKDLTTTNGITEPSGKEQELQKLETKRNEDGSDKEVKGNKKGKKNNGKQKGETAEGGKSTKVKIILAFTVGIVAGLLVNKFILPNVFGMVGWWS
ncbi:hypothetical protein [Bacillus thuringiensis]|uniref:hypothetical protein n=1 Tax=Bacillus thuringiensis TaxID=1428 RepID=UPI000BFC9F18|nr:hypothetical protein [Bacillus thuringiensis]PGT89935.1 hypothetical protein COD17_09300 [Bacillus thuringiensis]